VEGYYSNYVSPLPHSPSPARPRPGTVAKKGAAIQHHSRRCLALAISRRRLTLAVALPSHPHRHALALAQVDAATGSSPSPWQPAPPQHRACLTIQGRIGLSRAPPPAYLRQSGATGLPSALCGAPCGLPSALRSAAAGLPLSSRGAAAAGLPLLALVVGRTTILPPSHRPRLM